MASFFHISRYNFVFFILKSRYGVFDIFVLNKDIVCIVCLYGEYAYFSFSQNSASLGENTHQGKVERAKYL